MRPADRLPEPPAARPLSLLAGVRVLDLTTSIAAPYATMLLGDLGAEVLKVERPGSGDDSRAWGPPFLDGESLWYLSVNRNKASIALDYAVPAGREALHRLVKAADVVVVNLAGRVQEKLGIDEATLRAIRPDLIHVSLTGFGMTGERRDWPCYDLVAEGYSGVMDLTGTPDAPPQKVGTPAADLLAGMDAVIGTLAALFERRGSGRGHAIDVAMIESMTRFMTPRLVSYLGSGELPRRSGATDSVIAIYQAFATADDPITLGLGNDAIWRRFWEAVGEPDRGLDPALAGNAQRRMQREEIVADIQAILSRRPRAHWLALFEAARIPAGPINRLDEVAADEELVRRGFLYRMQAGGRSVPQVGLGIRFDGEPSVPRRAPPALGADTQDALSGWAGYSAAEITGLRRKGVIGA